MITINGCCQSWQNSLMFNLQFGRQLQTAATAFRHFDGNMRSKSTMQASAWPYTIVAPFFCPWRICLQALDALSKSASVEARHGIACQPLAATITVADIGRFVFKSFIYAMTPFPSGGSRKREKKKRRSGREEKEKKKKRGAVGPL